MRGTTGTIRQRPRTRGPLTWLVVAATLAGVSGLASLPGQAAAAARSPRATTPSPWSIIPSPNLDYEGGANELRGVSCVASGFCMAVGSAGSGGGVHTVAESSDDASWSLVDSPNVAGSIYDYLDADSCTSAEFCMAVGYDVVDTNETLTEVWNGQSWRIVDSPEESGADDSYLHGVSCVSPDDCTAVGTYVNTKEDHDGTLVESWDGSSWSVVDSPDAVGDYINALVAVSCDAKTSCAATGYSNARDAFPQNLIEADNAKGWSVETSPDAGTSDNYLYGVSCTSAVDCTAVGQFFNGSRYRPVVQSWNGKAWKPASLPSFGASLNGVSCPTADACTAVGSGGLIESWSGRSWVVVPTPQTIDLNRHLAAVSCVTASLCTAVGNYYNGKIDQTFIEQRCSATEVGSDRSRALSDAVTCPLVVKSLAFGDDPVAGLTVDDGAVRFLSNDDVTQFEKVDGVDVSFSRRCLSGCTNIGVRVTALNGEAAKDAKVTATVENLRISAPVQVQPPSAGPGYVCDLGAGGECGTTVTATTDDQGIALFRYWLPGVVNPDLSMFGLPNPRETIQFTATKIGTCGCLFAKGTDRLTVELHPRLWLHKTVVVTLAELDGLQALISKNAITKKDAQTDLKDILQVLKAAKVLSKDAIGEVQGIADQAFSAQMDELLRTDPDLVTLDWFMNKFGIASDGLLNANLDPNAWGQELAKNLIPILAGKIVDKVKLLKKYESKIESLITSTWNKVSGDAFQQEALTITKALIERASVKPRAAGRATLKLFDVSRCSGQCIDLPLPRDDDKLFMLFSEVNAGQENYSFQSRNPLGFTAQTWLPAQCSAAFGCDTNNM